MPPTPKAVRVRTSGGWQDIALTGPQGPAGVGVPTPVVNGQFIKGSGGAAVWSAITGSDIADGTITDAEIAAAAGIEGNKLAWHRGTTPPASPFDGMLWLYPFSVGYWKFVYDSTEATYKWKFIGGPPIRSGNATDQTYTDNSSYQNLGPAITLPRAGDYWFLANSNHYYATQTAGSDGALGHKVVISNGSLETNDSSIAQALARSGVGVACMSQGVNLDTIAGGTLTMQYAATADATGVAHVRWRLLTAIPIRVI